MILIILGNLELKEIKLLQNALGRRDSLDLWLYPGGAAKRSGCCLEQTLHLVVRIGTEKHIYVQGNARPGSHSAPELLHQFRAQLAHLLTLELAAKGQKPPAADIHHHPA